MDGKRGGASILNFHIRKLNPTDVAAYRALRVEIIGAHPTAFTSSVAEEMAADDARFLADFGPHAWVMGAFEGADLIGVAGLRAERKRQAAHKATLFGMAVRAAAHGKGVGRALVRAVIEEARRSGLKQLVLTYTEGNLPAERLYRACGFVEFGREPRAVIVNGIDIAKVHMIRMLDDL
jgi:GNAT superfamily N-acetyltransferase